MALRAGTRIGAYEVASLLGAGGMGEVCRAFDPRLRREAALEVNSQPLTADSVAVDRFIREALAAPALAEHARDQRDASDLLARLGSVS